MSISATPKPRTAGTRSDVPLLDVVVVSSTGAHDLLRDCLRSLRAHPISSGPMRVHVVDNASTDGTADMVRREFPEVVLHALDHNSGFCHANNVVLRDSEAPYALVLNPDTEVYEGALEHMIGVMEADPSIGMSSCRLAKRDGTFDHAAKRSFPTPLAAVSHFLGISGRPRAPKAFAQYRAPEVGEFEAGEVDAVNGAFMLVRQEALREVGLFDLQYWLYMEDLDWCYRFREKGWKIWYDGSVTILHVKGGTTVRKRHRGLRHNYAFHRGMGRFYRKFYSGKNPALDAAVYVAIVAKFAVAYVRSSVARRSLT